MSDKCSDILQQGIFNTVRLKSYDNVEQQFFEFLSTATRQEARAATDLGLDLTFPVDGVPVPLGVNFTDSQWNTWSNARQKLTKTSFTRETVIDRFTRTVDHELVSAWSSCMTAAQNAAAKSKGWVLEATQDEKSGIVKLIIRLAVQGGVVTATVNSFLVTNATLIGGHEPKKIDNRADVQLIYQTSDPTKAVIVAISTTRGPLFELLPPIQPQQLVKRQAGRDFGAAAPTPPLSIVAEEDQEVRIFGACIAQYEQPGDPSATAWLYFDKIDPNTLAWQSPANVQMQYPHPAVSLFNQTFLGTLVGQFDFRCDVKKGATLTLVGDTKNQHAKAAHFLIYIDYLGKRQEGAPADVFAAELGKMVFTE